MTMTHGHQRRHRRATAVPLRGAPPRAGSVFLTTHPRARLALLLSAPLFWLGVVYIVALALLLVTAFWSVDSFTGDIDRVDARQHHHGRHRLALPDRDAPHARRRARVTLIDVALALPIAFFMAKVATPRMQRVLVILVLTPLWATYLVKAYAWRSVLSQDGILEWLLARSAATPPDTACRPRSSRCPTSGCPT